MKKTAALKKTKMLIYLSASDSEYLGDSLSKLPDYCSKTFREFRTGSWWGEFIITDENAPTVADGDMVSDFAPYFPVLMELKSHFRAEFELHVFVGEPACHFFNLPSHMVALLAALGASINISQSDP